MREREVKRSVGRLSTTVLLYVEDSYLREFDATVLRTGPGYVVLDRTAFYPESGGQPSDAGFLRSGPQTARVFKVLRRGDDIFHYIQGTLSEGAAVHGVLDWDARFLNMRRHSAEHLLSSLFQRVGEGPKVYSNLTRIEFKSSDLTEDEVHQVEADFNKAVEANVPIRTSYAARGELDVGGDERKKMFLEKIPRNIEKLRMVEIQGYDRTFCFGTHVRTTGEIGHLEDLELLKGKRRRRVVLFTLE